MPPESPVHLLMDESLMEHDAMWRRFLSPESDGGIAITDGEARRARVHFYQAVAPHCLTGSDSLRVIGSITRSSQGVCGHRPLRHIHNVVRLRGKAKDPVPA